MTDRRHYPTREARLRSLIPLALAWAVGATVVTGVWLQEGIPAEDLFLNATFLGGRAWYIGMVGALGVLAWTVSACGCLGAAWVAHLGNRASATSAFRGAGCLFALLGLDDLFGFHATLFPYYVGISKLTVLASYGALALAWAWSSRTEIMRTRWELLGAASFAFAISMLVEVGWNGDDSGVRLMFEDGAKFMGVLALASWSISSATDLVRSVVRGALATGRPTPDPIRSYSVK